ncbi:hypothetical protein DFH94DRAFT_683154 [Russula ochroleuca]|uniref:Uncharacterized protein n=1 Tax=Russula ochroleuca TaxID=152965 RepID=A0A9P5MSY7_9AGAM|nr:hypothetical protein DFH94DRAFT_683154 [Russula ochroleuca]
MSGWPSVLKPVLSETPTLLTTQTSFDVSNSEFQHVWASIAYKAETYLTQPSSEGGHMGMGEDVKDVGWHRGIKWALALWRRCADGEGEGKDWAKLGEGVMSGGEEFWR